jgi:tRNA(His) guanylyltransferase
MKDSLGDRIKQNYEVRARHYLTRRTPVVVRVDGRAFHTYTRRFRKPFDRRLIDAMVAAAYQVCSEMQGVKMAYIQSDEASFVLTDYDDLQTQAWLNYCQNKIESLTAAIMSVAFQGAMRLAGVQDVAVFDGRAFNVPEEEVANYFLWRAKDWQRNSVQMLAQAHFSHEQLQGKSIHRCQDMLTKAGHPWDSLLDDEKYGTFIVGTGGLITEHYVPACYTEIAKLWDRVNPTNALVTRSEPQGLAKSGSATRSGTNTSTSGCSLVGSSRKRRETSPSKT